MLSKTNLCDARGCRRRAAQAFDVFSAWRLDAKKDTLRHYELCEKHVNEFFPRGEGFVDVDRSNRIKRLLVDSGRVASATPTVSVGTEEVDSK